MAADWGSLGCLCVRSWHGGDHCRRLSSAQVQKSFYAGVVFVMLECICRGALEILIRALEALCASL